MEPTLDGHLRHWARWSPDNVAIRFTGRDYTWGDLDRAADELAAGLTELGVGHGDVVGILLSNRPEFIEATMAILRLGAIMAPLNIRQTSHELAHPVVESGCRVIVSEPKLLDKLDHARAIDPHLVIVSTEPYGDLLELSALRRPGHRPDPVSITTDDGAYLCYTSGTSGLPKAALLTHGSVRVGGLGKVIPEGITFRDRLLLPGALAFTGGIVGCFSQITLISGGTVVLEPDFDASRCLEIIERERITVLFLVPSILQFIADLPGFDTADLSSLWSVGSGGAPVPAHLLRRYQERGIRMTQVYGLTEASTGVCALSADRALDKIGYAGVPMPHVEVRIVDDNDVDVPTGHVGEIIVRGPTIMKEYWRQPEATAHALRGGWLHTGDLGLLDEDGYLKVVDRAKDMLISGGLNVFPAEIERVLAGHPGIAELAVIGVPDHRWGEVPMLIVGGTDLPHVPGLVERCRDELADYKRPKYLHAHGGPLPRNMANKLLKRELRELYPVTPPDAVRIF